MRIKRPSTGTMLGGLALFVALGGTAAAATGSLVNIADPTTASNVAHVDSAGRLQVGDSAGPLTVQQATTSNYFHAASLNNSLGSATACIVIASAPSTHGVVVRDLRVNNTLESGVGSANFVHIFGDTTCTTQIASINPAQNGQTVIPFDPGYAIPAGGGLSAEGLGGYADFYTDGYTH